MISHQHQIDEGLTRAEDLIRSGQSKSGLDVAAEILKSQETHLNDRQKVKLANLLRRAGNFEAAIGLLHKKARGTVKVDDDVRAARAEYGCALIQLGLLEEAREMLHGLDTKQNPMVLLYLGLSYFSDWNYGEAVPLLEAFVAASGVDPYQIRVGRVNLLVAKAYAKPDESLLQDIETLMTEIQREKLNLLEGVLNQVKGRLLTTLGYYSKASEIYAAGLENLKNVETFDRFHMEKWDIFNDIGRYGPREDDGTRLQHLKARAVARRDYETARDCDFYFAKYYGGPSEINYCYYGSPFPAYRARFKSMGVVSPVILEIGNKNQIPIRVRISKRGARALEISNALQARNKNQLKFGGLLHRVFMALLTDFYRPMTVPRLFRYAFAGQYWNPNSSPVKVRQALFRLRQWLHHSKIGLQIQEREEQYFLVAKQKSVALVVSEMSSHQDLPEHKLIQDLISRLKKKRFTFKEFLETAGVSVRTGRWMIQNLIRESLIEKIGTTRNVLYKIKAVPSVPNK